MVNQDRPLEEFETKILELYHPTQSCNNTLCHTVRTQEKEGRVNLNQKEKRISFSQALQTQAHTTDRDTNQVGEIKSFKAIHISNTERCYKEECYRVVE